MKSHINDMSYNMAVLSCHITLYLVSKTWYPFCNFNIFGMYVLENKKWYF